MSGVIRIKYRVNKLFERRRRIAYSTIEIGRGDDVVTCARDGADGHKLCGLATGGRHGSRAAFECGNALFKDALEECAPGYFSKGAPKLPHARWEETYHCRVPDARINVSGCTETKQICAMLKR